MNNNDYMNKEQKIFFLNTLKDIKDGLTKKIENLSNILTDKQKFPDVVDQANKNEELRVELRTRDRERKLIKKIEESIQSIREGAYGYCKSCNKEIGIERLKIRPIASMCIDCKIENEEFEKKSRV